MGCHIISYWFLERTALKLMKSLAKTLTRSTFRNFTGLLSWGAASMKCGQESRKCESVGSLYGWSSGTAHSWTVGSMQFISFIILQTLSSNNASLCRLKQYSFYYYRIHFYKSLQPNYSFVLRYILWPLGKQQTSKEFWSPPPWTASGTRGVACRMWDLTVWKKHGYLLFIYDIYPCLNEFSTIWLFLDIFTTLRYRSLKQATVCRVSCVPECNFLSTEMIS